MVGPPLYRNMELHMILSKQKITVLIVGIAIVAVVVVKLILFHPVGSIDSVAARTQGPAQAKVNIVEFIDFECPACSKGAAELKGYLIKHPQDIHLQVQYFPLMNMHRHALQVASYAECVSRQGKFWPFFDTLMPLQPQWSPLLSAEVIFDQIAGQAGVKADELKRCLSSEDVFNTVMNEKSFGRSLGVKSTPTYFINNKMVVGYKSLAEELRKYFPQDSK